jgi:hypothetical protein
MNIIDINDFKKPESIEFIPTDLSPLHHTLTEDEMDHVNALLEYFSDEDRHSLFKILWAAINMVILDPSSSSEESDFMAPLNDNSVAPTGT